MAKPWHATQEESSVQLLYEAQFSALLLLQAVQLLVPTWKPYRAIQYSHMLGLTETQDSQLESAHGVQVPLWSEYVEAHFKQVIPSMSQISQ